MINSFLHFKTKNVNSKMLELEDIQQASKVLFSLFTRYGDTIIDLVVIKEFIEHYPDKEYLILCPRQMKPYVNELLSNIECIALNKRNLFDMLKINRKLKKWQPDIGFNPWSNGLDSCYFLTYCKKFLCYKDYDRPEIINHYQVVRKYLQLLKKDWNIKKITLKDNYQQILICPQSTSADRSISNAKINELIVGFNKQDNHPKITIASMDKTHFRDECDQFIFSKSAKSSQNFINLVKRSDIVVCSDSGPLHIASALHKDIMALFIITEPKIVVNYNSNVKYIKI